MAQRDSTCALLRPPRVFDLRQFFDLFKLRIGLVIGLTAVTGLVVSRASAVPAWRVAALALAVTLASAAAGAFNQFAERDLDARMRRTRQRAFVTGQLNANPTWLIVIIAIGCAGVALAAAALNVAAAAFTLCGALTYAVVYTLWLKRRTWWNIVIGGLAGSFAVLAGAAAAPASVWQPLPMLFAGVLFLWTPPHFWSLAIAYREDYATARVPMLPVVAGNARAGRAVFGGTILLVVVAILPCAFGMGWVYAAAAIGAGIYLLVKSARLARRPERRSAMANFHASIAYLALLLAAAIADTVSRQ